MTMIADYIMETLDFSALIIGLISLIAAYYKVNKESENNENVIIKDYYISFIDELNKRNKNLTDKIDELEKHLDIAEEKYQKCINKIMAAKCVNIEEES
jgi:hypothetical protein